MSLLDEPSSAGPNESLRVRDAAGVSILAGEDFVGLTEVRLRVNLGHARFHLYQSRDYGQHVPSHCQRYSVTKDLRVQSE